MTNTTLTDADGPFVAALITNIVIGLVASLLFLVLRPHVPAVFSPRCAVPGD